ncbi:hypothetical protein PVK06_017561 [Gossypium arboreum]|uniref:Uncharacterized protein n=1 Tax=Gossypium arboreum TaxID=29729 RepID=A0ABR0Q3S5_GOSAR|nr:hypothetical protein PVK06_017561 [Gossypium arboreum]
MKTKMMKMLQEISKALLTRKKDVPNLQNFDHEDPCTNVNHYEIHGEIQIELGTKDHEDKLNIVKAISDLIDITTYVTIEVKVKNELTINKEFKLILNEIVEEPLHFLAIAEKVPNGEVNELNSFSFDKVNEV